MPFPALQQDDGFSLTARLLWLRILPGVDQPENVSPLASAVSGGCLRARNGRGTPGRWHLAFEEVDPPFITLPVVGSAWGIARRGHCRAAGPHDRVLGFTLQPIRSADFCVCRAPDQNRFPEVSFVDSCGRAGYPSPAPCGRRPRAECGGWGVKLSAILGLRKPLG
jgi:hypothetical protein